MIKRLKASAQNECVFCGAREKLTGEHVFADWLAPYLPKIGHSGHTASKTVRILDGASLKIESNRHLLRDGVLHRKGPARKQTLKIVCNSCNNVWMSRLQEQVKPILLPMLEGRWPNAISVWERRILAAWAAMFTMVIEFADLDTQVTPFAGRERLRLTLEPPERWYVWIGLHTGVLWTLGFNHFAWSRPKFVWPGQLEPLPAAIAAAEKKEVQSTGWVLGPIFFQTISARVPGYTVDELAFAKKHGLRVVWPSGDNLPIERPVTVMDDIDADNASAGLLPPYFPRETIRRAWETWGKH
jgi:hypothetical protein